MFYFSVVRNELFSDYRALSVVETHCGPMSLNGLSAWWLLLKILYLMGLLCLLSLSKAGQKAFFYHFAPRISNEIALKSLGNIWLVMARSLFTSGGRAKGKAFLRHLHSSPKETQLWSCLSCGEECRSVKVGPNVIVTLLLVPICQKPHFKISHRTRSVIRHLSTSHCWNSTKLEASSKFESCLSFW